MQSRIDVGHKHRKTYNAFNIIPLGIFVIVSSMPSNALAFESTLAVSPTQRFIAHVQVEREENDTTVLPNPLVPDQRSHAVLATPTPVTVVAHWPRTQPVIPESTPVPAPVAVAAAPVAPSAPAPGSPVLVLVGEASYYSRAGCLGCSPTMTMANGQPLNDNALTMAIGADRKHLVGRKAVVTNLATGMSVTVTITDTGGFYKARYGNRVADLTIATKQAIGMNGGLGQVRVEVY